MSRRGAWEVWIALALVAALTTAWTAAAQEGWEAVIRFAGGQIPAERAPLPVEIRADPTSTDRALDVLVLVAFAGALVGGGYLLRRSGLPGYRPLVGASVALGVAMLTVVNLEPFQVEKIVIDEGGITELRYGAAPVTVGWREVKELRWDEGRLFPVFTEDGALRLITAGGVQVSLPEWARDRPAIAAAVAARLNP